MPEDWKEPRGCWEIEGGWKPGKILIVGYAIHRFTEILELAASFAAPDEVGDYLQVDLGIFGLAGRSLWNADPHHGSRDEGPAKLPEFPKQWFMPRDKFASDPRALAREVMFEFFKYFGWNPSLEDLQPWQEEHPSVRRRQLRAPP